ncbi:DJ-1/PfpI family protein [Pararcticibacter amylolyticus]|uniref:Dimethyladenosine transferase n=1 Tax=Pararcticibacter amylolyticus TaxID=2173175 RepID=A0A2U2PN24_9SPHI|nr:DJ-1/PfpI family protein [Pararcticibacter amylolyticus]PWG82682.1 dimethyladenosine transferase [Pararcticibacter amylolyticus]
MTNVNLLIFDQFETLDLFGPVEVLGRIDTMNLCYYSLHGGLVQSRDKANIMTGKISDADARGILLVPGGMGTRPLVSDDEFISVLRSLAEQSLNVLTVCTGSALLAKTGLLNKIRATSNKKAFDWVRSVNRDVIWMEKARWVHDGKFYTSSGVSAGIDMALGYVADSFGKDQALEIAGHIEYVWNQDSSDDPFSAKGKS